MDQSKMKVVYVITKRGERSFWNRIGVAFVNRDGSLNVKLEAIPVDGACHIRDYVPREDSLGSSTGRDLLELSTGNGRSEAFAEIA
jgi:hypothetical protein